MQPWQQAAQQAQRDAQSTIQHGIDSGRRHDQGGGRRPTSVIGGITHAILNLIGFIIALAILGVAGVVGYFIITSR
jgi:hypothetical protein